MCSILQTPVNPLPAIHSLSASRLQLHARCFSSWLMACLSLIAVFSCVPLVCAGCQRPFNCWFNCMWRGTICYGRSLRCVLCQTMCVWTGKFHRNWTPSYWGFRLLGFCYVFACTYLCTCWQVLTWLETNARAVAQKYKATDPTFVEHTQRWEMCLYMTVCTTYVWAYFSLCCARHPMCFSSTCVSLVSSSLLECHSVTQSITIFTNQWNKLDTEQCSPTPCYGWWWLWISTPVICMSTRHSLN